MKRTIYISQTTAETLGRTLQACGTISRFRVFPVTGSHADRSGYQGYALVCWDKNGHKFNA